MYWIDPHTSRIGDEPRTGCLPCDGGAVPRSLYPRLFQLIGTTYGAGDGATTFNIPHLARSEEQ